jgi:hypothetical protein
LIVELFSSTLPADVLYDESSLPWSMTSWLWRVPRPRESDVSKRK